MNDGLKIIGEVYAWREGEQGCYGAQDVADYAEPATLVEFDGELVLSILRADRCYNISGALQVS